MEGGKLVEDSWPPKTMKGLGASPSEEPSEEEIISHYKTGMLYSHAFEGGRFFEMVHDDSDGFVVKLAARTMLKVVYLRDKDDIEGFEIIKLITGQPTQRVKLNKFNFQQLALFLDFISNRIDLKLITERRLQIADNEGLDAENIKRVKTILSKEGGEDLIRTLIDEGILSSRDLVNTAYRKRELAKFRWMLKKPESWKVYAERYSISTHSEEKVWQHFFARNEWIFGYGLDYRFNGILQKEFHASGTQADGSGATVTDFLLADKRFTTFVEIKKPSTPIFRSSANRSNAWSLSRDLIDAVSQILEHKASGQFRLEIGQLYDSTGRLITQKPYDSKVLLIIGNWDKIRSSSQKEKRIKEKTFELYRRDSRNIKILTFDELYDRAKFIVQHATTDSSQ